MNNETNKLLEAILITLQDNGKDIRDLKAEMRGVKDEVSGLKAEMRGVKDEIKLLGIRMANVEVAVLGLDKRMANVETAVVSNTLAIQQLDKRMANVEVVVVANSEEMKSLNAHVQENTREIRLLRQTTERHDEEITKLIEVFGGDIRDLKKRVSNLETKS